MKRKLLLLVVLTIALLALLSPTSAASNISVTLDGQEIQFSEAFGYPFMDKNSVVQVPLRIVMEAYDCFLLGTL